MSPVEGYGEISNTMTLKTCLRCDWQGETRHPECPTCGVQPLYVLGASSRKGSGTPVRDHAVGRTREVASTASMAPPAPRSPQSSPSPPAADAEGSPSSTRSGRSPLALALAALVLIVILGTWLKTQEDRLAPAASTDGVEQGRPLESVGLPPPDGTPSPLLSEGASIQGPLLDKRGTATVENVSFSFRVPTSGWEVHGTYISKSTVGPQGAEAMVYWTSIADGPLIRSCGQWWSSPVGSLADYAVSASSMRGIELVTGPSDVTIGGRAAQRVVFTVREEVGCNPGFFYTWKEGNPGGAFWTETQVDDTIRVWLVDVFGERVFIEGDTHKNAGSRLNQEIQQIVSSIRFR